MDYEVSAAAPMLYKLGSHIKGHAPLPVRLVVVVAAVASLVTVVLTTLVTTMVSSECNNKYLRSEKETTSYYGQPALVDREFQYDLYGMVDQETGVYRYKDEEWTSDRWPRFGGVVALSRELVEKQGLQDAAVASDDPTKMIYYVAGFHQLHCMSVVRDAIYYLNGTLQNWHDNAGFDWDHVLHCIESVRQALDCAMDPTLMSISNEWPILPQNQKHRCRNRDVLFQWATENSHSMPLVPTPEDYKRKSAIGSRNSSCTISLG